MTSAPALFDATSALELAGKRVLMTGATGFIGRHFARQALAAGIEAIAIGRNPGPDGLAFRHADLNDATAIVKSVRVVAPDAIVHFASPGVAYGTANFDEVLHALVTGGEALLRAASELPSPPHFVQIGSGFEYAPQQRPIREDDPIVPSSTAYGAAKAAASALLGGYAGRLPITLVRPFNIHGAGDLSPRLGNWVIDRALAGDPIPVTAGEQVRDFLHVDDFCRLVWQLTADAPAGSRFRVLNAGSGEQRTVRSYIEALAAELEAAGKPARVEFGAVAYRSGEPMIAVPDLTALRAATSWTPRISFTAGVADFALWRLSR